VSGAGSAARAGAASPAGHASSRQQRRARLIGSLGNEAEW
jgi:hypothetical protein